MLFIVGLALILLAAFVAYLVFAVFVAKLIFIFFAGIAAALYFAIFLALNAALGPENFVGAVGGSLVIGTALLLMIAKAYRHAEAEQARLAEEARAEAAAAVLRAQADKVRAAEQARAEQAALRLQVEAANAAKQKADCHCGSMRPFEECHGMTLRSAAEAVLLPTLKKGWKSVITSINNKL